MLTVLGQARYVDESTEHVSQQSPMGIDHGPVFVCRSFQDRSRTNCTLD